MHHRLPPCVRRPGGSRAGYGRSLPRGGAHRAPGALQWRVVCVIRLRRVAVGAFLVSITLMPGVTEHVSHRARAWNWGIVGLVAAGALATVALRPRSPGAPNDDVAAF